MSENIKNLVKGENFLIESLSDPIQAKIEWSSLDNKSIDISAFILTNEKIQTESDFIYFNNLQSNGVYLINILNGVIIKIDLRFLNKNVQKISIVATINGGKFGEVQNFSISTENRKFNISATNENALTIAEFYLKNGQWKFRAVGDGYLSGLEKIAENFGLDLSKLSSDEKQLKFRRSSKDIILDYINEIKYNFNQIKSLLKPAIDNKYNESDTRMILNKFLIEVLGYQITELKTEQKIQGRKADYVLSVENNDYIVIEVKRAGMPLKEKQIFQATSYSAYSGIKLALLTNLMEWQLYFINYSSAVEPELVFSLNLENIKDEDFEYLFAISRNGIIRKNSISRILDKNRALSHSSIISAVFTEDVINKIKGTINKNSSYKVSYDEIKNILEEILNI